MTEDGDLLRRLFDEELEVRHSGELRLALSMCEGLLRRFPTARPAWRAMVHAEAGHIFELIGDMHEAERHFLEATRCCPHSEVASMSLFHAMWSRNDIEGALTEAIRFIELWESPGYHELFFTPGYGRDLDGACNDLLEDAKDILTRRRSRN